MSTELRSILSPEGAIARRLGDLYEHRPEQIEMAAAVESALEQKKHLLVEAGTGVGKSFAYLLPLVQYAIKNKKRVIVSTHSISLQEQLIEKDIPLIQAVYPDEFTAVLVKGRGNYLCRRRLEQARARQGMLFDRPEQLQSLHVIDEWSRRTTDGSLADLPGVSAPDVWDRVCAEQGNCLGKRCTYYNDCFWQSAKRRMSSGDLLIVNHALFFSDLALRMSGVQYLPKYDVVVLDEAHTVEDVAADHFGLRISEPGIRHHLRTLYDAKRGMGVLTTHGAGANDCIDAVVEINLRLENFFGRCAEWQQAQGRSNGRIHEPNFIENDLSPLLRELSLHQKAMLAHVKSEEDVSELSAMMEKTALLAEELDAVVAHKMPEAVYWMETSRQRRSVSLRAAPITVSGSLRENLFEKLHSVVMCSATMCASGKEKSGSFEYIASRLGVEGADTLALGSPFDYAKQATLYIESDLPDPTDARKFVPAACEKILHYLQETQGGAFVLFTSYATLTEAAATLRPALEELNYPLLVQEREVSRKQLLEKFRTLPNAVLFGTSSFWQGIDVRGDSLRNVIIVKLPFSAPDEPLIEARLDEIKRRGGNAFMEYSVPEAIIRLKQGFGRLIRSKTDRGMVVILDSRIQTRRYGRRFLEALPPCQVVVKP